MADLDLRQLQTLVSVAEEGTFSRAANALGYTQSSVSQQIAALERAVGGSVFERPGGPRPVRITPLGDVVLAQAREVLSKADALRDAVERFHAGDGRVDIGTLQGVSNIILPAVVRRLRDEHPRCDIRLSEEESDDPTFGDLDLLFHDGPIREESDHVVLLEDPYLLVALPGAFPEGPVAAKMLDAKPMVAWPSICDQPRMEHTLEEAGASPDIVFRSARTETILSLARAGMGLAVLPWLAIDHDICRSCGGIHGALGDTDQVLHVHPLDPSPSREIHLHWPRGRAEESPLAARAIEIAIEVARGLPSQRGAPVEH